MSEFTEITYSAKQVICENPRLIINPLLPELIAKYRTYVFRGNLERTSKIHVHYYNFDYRPFSIKRNQITTDDIDSCFVLDTDSGDTFPIYVQVPCNHCDVCKQRTISGFVQRCKMETACYDNKPWFITLTYDNKHLPSTGVQVVDVQRFLKRFRINLVRSGFVDRIRYVAVGEYGKNTHRAHYHLIVWNLDVFQHRQYLEISSLIDKSWQCGFTQHRLIDPANDKAFYYTAKYLKKELIVPKGCNPFFVLSSRGKGGIGSRFIDSISSELHRTLNINFKWLNKWTNRVEDMIFSSYVLNRIFPSYHKSVRSDFRADLRDYALRYSILKRVENDKLNFFKEQYERFITLYSPYTFFGEVLYTEIPSAFLPDRRSLFEELQTIGERLEKWCSFDFEKAKEIAEKRDRFIFKLFEHFQPIDIGARAAKCRRAFHLSRAREIF